MNLIIRKTFLLVFTAVAVFITKAQDINGVEGWLFYKLVDYESGSNPGCISKNENGTFDLGMMQLNSAYIEYYAMMYNNGEAFDPMNEEDNVRIGCAYLVDLKRRTGSWFRAVWAYNAGPGNWRKGKMPGRTRLMLIAIFGTANEYELPYTVIRNYVR